MSSEYALEDELAEARAEIERLKAQSERLLDENRRMGADMIRERQQRTDTGEIERLKSENHQLRGKCGGIDLEPFVDAIIDAYRTPLAGDESARIRSVLAELVRVTRVTRPESDPAPWIPCPGGCPDPFCTIHGEHAFACPCPPVEEWERSPYRATRAAERVRTPRA